EIDIVMLCTPPGYRPMHFEAAVEAKKHVFAEKPFGTDPVNVRRFMAAAKKSEELKLTVMSGAQRRSQKEYVETVKRIKDGAIGVHMSSYCWPYPHGLPTSISAVVVATTSLITCKNKGREGEDAYVQQHIDMVKSIRGQRPYINHPMTITESTMTCIMAGEFE